MPTRGLSMWLGFHLAWWLVSERGEAKSRCFTKPRRRLPGFKTWLHRSEGITCASLLIEQSLALSDFGGGGDMDPPMDGRSVKDLKSFFLFLKKTFLINLALFHC